MRKRLITDVQPDTTIPAHEWLNLEGIAEVEITSEDAAHPIESALLPGRTPGWRAADYGEQMIRLVFNHPQNLKYIYLNFVESGTERTQEYLLRWSEDGGKSYQDIVRQLWNFHPDGAACETEEYQVGLSGVTVLELSIIPDISGRDVYASLEQLRLA